MAPLAKRSLLAALVFLVSAVALGAQEPSRHVRFGLPSLAATDLKQRDDYLLVRPQYVLSYNGVTRTPNWVAWSLHRNDLGKASRGPFEPDPLLPKGFSHVTTHVYDGSGFDRGHMCPAQDRSSSQANMDATFFTTNIVPQAPNCNQRGWERLESYCRDLTKQGHVLYITCGPHGAGGTGKDGFKEEIGKGRVKITVPAKLWKLIMVLPHEDAEPRKNTRVIAVIMSNDQSVGFDWTRYRVSVRDVEKLTGYTFFRNIPDDLAAALKADVDDVKVRVPVTRRTRE